MFNHHFPTCYTSSGSPFCRTGCTPQASSQSLKQDAIRWILEAMTITVQCPTKLYLLSKLKTSGGVLFQTAGLPGQQNNARHIYRRTYLYADDKYQICGQYAMRAREVKKDCRLIKITRTKHQNRIQIMHFLKKSTDFVQYIHLTQLQTMPFQDIYLKRQWYLDYSVTNRRELNRYLKPSSS